MIFTQLMHIYRIITQVTFVLVLQMLILEYTIGCTHNTVYSYIVLICFLPNDLI